MTLEIRPLHPSDEQVWRKLWTGYLEFYESEVSEEVYQSTFQRLLSEGLMTLPPLSRGTERARWV